jgi:hypothetical protein
MVAGFISLAIGHRVEWSDFRVYYYAAKAFFNHQPIYGVPFALDQAGFKYSPFSAMMAAPFILLPYNVGLVLQYFILCAATIAMVIVAFNLVNHYLFGGQVKQGNTVLGIIIVCFVIHLQRELMLGNINLLLTLLLCLSLQFILEERFILSGVLLAFVLISKPFFALLLMPLLFHKYYKTLMSTTIALAVFILLPATVVGFAGDIDMHKQWLNTMLIHADSYYSPNTFDILVRKYFYAGLPSASQYVILAIVCVVYVAVFYLVKRNKTETTSRKDLIIEWLLLIAIMPNLFKTDTQHFLYSVPLLTVWCCYLFYSKNKIAIALYVFAILLYDTHSSDLWGYRLADDMYHLGVLGIGNLIIILAVTVYYFRSIRHLNS